MVLHIWRIKPDTWILFQLWDNFDNCSLSLLRSSVHLCWRGCVLGTPGRNSLQVSEEHVHVSFDVQNLQLQRELEQLRREKEQRERELEDENNELKGELTKIRAEMDAVLKELQTIIDTKLGLELEIAAYRKLLEGEEAR